MKWVLSDACHPGISRSGISGIQDRVCDPLWVPDRRFRDVRDDSTAHTQPISSRRTTSAITATPASLSLRQGT